FLVPNVVCIAVWAATGAGSFWPGWVLLGTGIAFAVFLIKFVVRVEDDNHRDSDDGAKRRHEHPAARVRRLPDPAARDGPGGRTRIRGRLPPYRHRRDVRQRAR